MSDVIETKQNGRKLDFIRKNKDVSKEAVDVLEKRKKIEYFESKLKQALRLNIEFQASLQEQKERMDELHVKVEKWRTRMEMNEAPMRRAIRVAELNIELEKLEETMEIEKVGEIDPSIDMKFI